MGKGIRTARLASLLIALRCAGAAGAAGADERRPAVLDLEGRIVQPLEGNAPRIGVFLFVRTDCPIANRYAPELRRLHTQFAPHGVVFQLVYTGPGESVAAILQHRRDYDYPMEALRDPQHALARWAGARVTPEAAVYVRGAEAARLVYHGRIDDRYVDLGLSRPAPSTHELEDVLTAILAGRPAPRESAPAVGCYISDQP